MNAIFLFLSTLALVFCLGLQSLNVNRGHYVAAFVTSFAIGASNLVLFKLAPDASGIEIAGYLLGGPIGIVCAMRAHGRLPDVCARRWRLMPVAGRVWVTSISVLCAGALIAHL